MRKLLYIQDPSVYDNLYHQTKILFMLSNKLHTITVRCSGETKVYQFGIRGLRNTPLNINVLKLLVNMDSPY